MNLVENALYVLNDLAQAESEDLDYACIDVFYEDENGNEGARTYEMPEIAELATKAINKLKQSQPKWISIEEFLDNQESEQHCWIVFKGQVKNAYFYKGAFNFAQLSATAYLTKCISAVMPIREPQPPEVSDDETE